MNTVPSMVSQQLGLLSSGAEPEDVRAGQSFIKPGSLAIQSGTMTDNGDLGTIIPGTTDTTIPEGYTSGGVVQGDPDLLPTNIKAGTDIFGVTGTAVLATGSAVEANVLFGVTYSSSSGAGTGTMPNNGSLGMIIPDTTSKTIPAGYTTGGTVAGSANLIPSNIRSGTSIYGVAGSVIPASGSATADKLLFGETASTTAGLITGTMPNNGSLGTITPGTTNKPIPLGYTTGGTVAGSGNLQAGNIRLGVNIFGVTGSLDPGTQTGGTAGPGDVLMGETFTNDSGVQTGNMPNNGAVNITPGSISATIPIGYHNGGGTVGAVTFDTTKVLTGTTIAGTAGTMTDNGSLGTITPGIDTQAIPSGYTSGGIVAGDIDLVPENIKSGVNIFGVDGTFENTTINGQIQQAVTYAGDLVAGDPIYTKTQFGSDVTITYPPSSASVRSAAWSPDDTYLAVSMAFSPYFALYKRSGSVFTKLSDPASMPGSSSLSNAWSHDGTYLSVVLASSPYFIVYKRNGDTLIKLPDAAVLPTSNTRSVAWSPDDTYLVLGHNSTPFISIYKRSGDAFTKLSDPSVLPTGLVSSVDFDPSGVHLVVGHGTSPFITIYKRSGDVFTKLSNPSVLPTGLVNASDFSSSGDLLSCACSTSPYLNVYKVTGDTFEKIPDFSDLPTSGANGVGFKSGTDLMSVGTTSSPYLQTYQRIGDTFKKVNTLNSNPPTRVYCVEYSRNATFLAIGLEQGSSSSMLLYSVSMAAYKSSNNIADLANADGAGYALSSGITGEKKDAIIIWR